MLTEAQPVSSESQLRALARADAHVQSETTNSVDTIMATVSQSVCYIMPDVSKSDLPVAVLNRREQVREYYSAERGFLEVIDSSNLVELSTSWYVFHEGFANTLEVKTGATFASQYAVLFPTADDGIIGEILWPRQSLIDIYQGVADHRAAAPSTEGAGPAQPEAGRRRNQATHDAYLAGLRGGDVDQAVGCWSAAAKVAVREGHGDDGAVLEGSGPGVVRQRIEHLLNAVSEPKVDLLSRVVGEWYIFADWVVRGSAAESSTHPGRPCELRIASVYGMDRDGLILAEVAYGLDRLLVAESTSDTTTTGALA